VGRSRTSSGLEYRIVAEPHAPVAVSAVAVATDHHKRTLCSADRDRGLVSIASCTGVDEASVVDSERSWRCGRLDRRAGRFGLRWRRAGRDSRRKGARRGDRPGSRPLQDGADRDDQRREQDRRSAERQSPAQQMSTGRRLLSVPAAGSGSACQIPRAGDQGRSRHATSCTGCAEHSARQRL